MLHHICNTATTTDRPCKTGHEVSWLCELQTYTSCHVSVQKWRSVNVRQHAQSSHAKKSVSSMCKLYTVIIIIIIIIAVISVSPYLTDKNALRFFTSLTEINT